MRHVALLLAVAGCGLSEPAPLPEHAFAFGVFGDGPYYPWENGRFARLIDDVNRHDLGFFVHVGDIFDAPCSDAAYRDRLARINTIQHPVIYAPGDNEWRDCHPARSGSYAPLERLGFLRRVFFADPHHSLGARPIALVAQADDPTFATFPEHAQWEFGTFLFVTMHMVGADLFPGHGPADEAAIVERTAAAMAWMDSAFQHAIREGLHGVVLIFHGEPGLERAPGREAGFDEFVDAIEDHAKAFRGEVLVIHGDWHELHVDHPLRDRETGEVLGNVTRLETFGSPDIGWVRVVVDTVSGQFVEFEPRLMPRRWLLF